jgi:ABC-type transporter Mla subunit MlaD
LSAAQVEPTVELDEIFNTFDKPTRDAFQSWVKELSVAIRGRGAGDLNDALGNLGPFATDGSVLLRTLDQQGVAVNRLVKNTGVAFGAINQRSGALRELIVNANNTFEATASQDRALAETIRVFPTFLDESKATLARLQGFAKETNPLVTQLKPAASDLGPAVRDLAALSPDLEALFKDLPGLVRAGKQGLPALTNVVSGSEPLFESAHVFLPELNPILSEFNFQQQVITQFLSGGTPDLAGTFGGKRYQTQVGLIDPDRVLARFEKEIPSTRGNAYMAPNSLLRGPALGVVSESFHCPGGKELRDAIDAAKIPPCFLLPPSLLTGKQFIHLGRGQAPYRKPPQRLEGTVPANPGR